MNVSPSDGVTVNVDVAPADPGVTDVGENEQVTPLLTEGSGGVFEVTVDGDLIFSKKKEGRFPEDEEILGPLAERA